MSNEKLSILSFPQKIDNGKLHINILVIPRNINPLLPLAAGFPSFGDAVAGFKAMIINSLDGLPLTTNAAEHAAVFDDVPVASTPVWNALKAQIQATDGLTIDDGETVSQENADAARAKYQAKSIKKHLPDSYRKAFNFTVPRTRYAFTGDEYDCAVNNTKPPTDVKTNRDKISWGKAVALCLRNPWLAAKAGLIYHVTVDVAGLFNEGGWIYFDFGAGSGFQMLDKTLVKYYAARIPALKKIKQRTLFAAVQFPVSAAPINDGDYDEIIREAIVYDDGFAKIVHANQPINNYLLKEDDNTNPPQKDIGIRLGWDDEQITIWHNRQMSQKEENTNNIVDAPLGVFSFCIDAKKETDTTWRSQNKIVAPHGISVNNVKIEMKGKHLELGTEVHPTAHGNSQTDGFWLPMYFTNWMGKSLAIPDKDAEDINQLTSDKVKPVTSKYPDSTLTDNTINTIPKKTFHPYLQDPQNVLPLIYGTTYNFRIRLTDITGGAPHIDDAPIHGAERPVETWHFKRHTGAGAVHVKNIQDKLNAHGNPTAAKPLPDTSILENVIDKTTSTLTIERPTLSYPAVVFTGKYNSPDAVTRLKDILKNLPASLNQQSVSIGLPDPDVNSFKVKVEIRSLEMDNALSETGKESFIKLYEKTFSFGADFYQTFALKITYNDFHQLPFDGSFNTTGNADELVLPTSRNIRLTFTSVVSNADNNYADISIAEGKTVLLTSRTHSHDETNLVTPVDDGVKAMYLQPETDGHAAPALINAAKQIVLSSTPVELTRIAEALFITAHNLTLEGIKGERTQFGCSKLMRHSLAPDSSSLTFSSLAEIFNHWVVAVNFTMHRDWSWDELAVESFDVYRSSRLESEASYGKEELVGITNIAPTANINALYNPQRDHTNLIFLDAYDPKKANDQFPQEAFLKYRLKPVFKKQKTPVSQTAIAPVEVHLPVTIIPHQIPELVSAGIALSPYGFDEKYTTTNIRSKFLWLEMKEPVANPNDIYYVRVIANAPDPYLCLVDNSILFNVPDEPPLNISDEKIRTIIPGMNNDFAGIGAMQEMIAEQQPNPRYYMVPLPAGLHNASDELFGFFTYEIRVGHKKELWSTAQARYGRPLKVNGVQHPAPTLICNAFRRKYIPEGLLIKVNEIVITAPFANAVLNGRNIAALPPQTSLWCFLYAQVKQADGNAYRNILIASKQMIYRGERDEQNQYLLTDEGTRYGMAHFLQQEIKDALFAIALPPTANLSTLCVEMFPLNNDWRVPSYGNIAGGFNNTYQHLPAANTANPADVYKQNNPLIDELGKHRIYRTSSLVPVENICCEDC